ncbi:serine/threonine-protein kinase [Actinoplanes sp. NPDC051859]|uniref:serine/threonine-protein kinase n=1 Tax=Actinoplanes sp. NPDC051859 TaxID=3363909 RepID=UPI00378F23E3
MDQDPTSSGARADSDGASTLDLSGRCVGSSYILLRPIGHGATGTVWRGVDRATGTPVAVKLLHASLLRQPKLVTRFVQERTILLMLRHRNVVRVRDLFSVGESLALVMDLVPGGSLRDFLREQPTLPAAEVARLGAQIAAALAEAHGLGIVHRDLKPDNLLLHRDADRLDIRLTDFGIARMLHSPGLTTTHAVVGTPHYMAPEAFHSSTTTPAADVYALGVLLYEMLSGRPPYDSDTVTDLMRLHLAGAPERRAGIPDLLWDILAACLERDPRLRPSSAELVTDLADVAARVDAPALPPLPHPRASRDGADMSSLGGPGDLADSGGSAGTGSSDRSGSPAGGRPSPESGATPGRDGLGGAGPEHAGECAHPSLAGGKRPRVPRRRNQPASWRWARPWAMIVLVCSAMLASGVATTAWHLGRAGEEPGGDVIVAGPTDVLPSAVPTSVVGSAAPSRAARQRSDDSGRKARKLPVAAAAVAPTRPRTSPTVTQPVTERTYGPWECAQQYVLSYDNAMAVRPCHKVGEKVQVSASLTAPRDGTGALTVELRDLANGRTLRAQTCDSLVFREGARSQQCGAATVSPPVGRRYQVVMSWRFTRDGRVEAGSARGGDFTF